MNKIILIIFYLLSLQAADIVIKLDSKPELFDVDNIGNIYVYNNYELKKYSPKGKLLCTYSQLNLGKAYSLDVSDPMQIMLFYKDFNQVVFLDNHLNILGKTIELDNLNINSVSAVCKSKQSAIWIYDYFENEIVKYAFNNQTIIERYKISNFKNSIHNITYILESGDFLYLNQGNECIWVLDKFAKDLQQLPIKTPQDFQVVNKNVICSNQYYNVSLKKSEKINNIDNIRYSNNIFYILKDRIIRTSFSYNN